MFLTVVLNADNFNFPSAECFNYLFDVLNSGSTSDDKHKHTDTNYTDHERYKLYLLLLEDLKFLLFLYYICIAFSDKGLPFLLRTAKDLISQIAHLQLQ